MDEIARYNQARWQALADANALFTRPRFDLDAESARELVDPEELLGDLNGKRVLCLAGGGGRQSAAYGLLGANVTVVDLSDAQLERDRQVAAHYGLNIQIIQGDMRDLSALPTDSFDLVDQPYSLNFVPDVLPVFAGVARVLGSGGMYRLMCANPFAAGMTERDWHETGYTISRPYLPGERLTYKDQDWVYDRDQHEQIAPPQEFRHTLSQLVNGLQANGLSITYLLEHQADSVSLDATPGTWDHFTAFMPPWLTFYTIRADNPLINRK